MSENSVLQIPEELKASKDDWPVIHIKSGDSQIWKRVGDSGFVEGVNQALYKALERVQRRGLKGQGLVKIHIGEPKCETRLRPEYTTGATAFLKDKGMDSVVCGDTTVAYTGPRGTRENPPGDVRRYEELARNHGWSSDGPAGIDFVVLDRPGDSGKGAFEFDEEEERLGLDGVNRFGDFFIAGGFKAADFTVNQAHLTLHGLAGVAGCVKGIAMGCSSLTGKLRMHQSLLPRFDKGKCVRCGSCVESCPEGALELKEGAECPEVDPELCIGCGECEAVCALRTGAIKLSGESVSDWERGAETLPVRMADYIIGLMNGKWQDVVHIMHMYAVTERCDCVDMRQKPMIENDLGFLVGKNPFAIDKLSGKLLSQALSEEGRETDEWLLKTAEETAEYVKEAYGIETDVPVEEIAI